MGVAFTFLWTSKVLTSKIFVSKFSYPKLLVTSDFLSTGQDNLPEISFIVQTNHDICNLISEFINWIRKSFNRQKISLVLFIFETN